MPSTYSTNLRIQLMQTGEKSGEWGDITNTNLGNVIEQALTYQSTVAVADSSTPTDLTSVDGTSVGDTARSLYIKLTGALTATRTVRCPQLKHLYIVQNATTGSQSVSFTSTAGGAGVTIPNGTSTMVYCDGTDVVSIVSYLPALTGSTITGGTINNTPIGGTTPASGVFTSGQANTWNILSGGTLNNVTLVNATGSYASLTIGTVTINGGTINGTAIGGTGAAAGSFTTLNSTGGSLNGSIGGTTPNSGAFTTLSSSGVYTNTVADGSTPMSITSTTRVSNLNVARSGFSDTGTVSDNTSSSSTYYPLLSPATSGNQALTTSSTKISFVPSTGKLTTSALAVGSLNGILKGSSGDVTTAVAGTDYVFPGSANNWTGLQTFSGTSSNIAAKFTNSVEASTSSASAATGTIALQAVNFSIAYYTLNATGNWIINLTGQVSPAVTLNTLMSAGDVITLVFLATQGTTAYYNTTVQVDGTTSGVTTRWQGGIAPTAGNPSGIDSYTYTILKTGAATFTVLASLTQFK